MILGVCIFMHLRLLQQELIHLGGFEPGAFSPKYVHAWFTDFTATHTHRQIYLNFKCSDISTWLKTRITGIKIKTETNVLNPRLRLDRVSGLVKT